MRDLVTRKSYRLRKQFDDTLFRLCPNFWVPLYNSVSFTHMPYTRCIENRKWQDKVSEAYSLRYRPNSANVLTFFFSGFDTSNTVVWNYFCRIFNKRIYCIIQLNQNDFEYYFRHTIIPLVCTKFVMCSH